MVRTAPQPLRAHNRVFAEVEPDEPSVLDRLRGLLTGLGQFSWRDMGIMRWLPKYTRSLLFQDLMAALVVAVILVPQGMAYAVLAGLEPVNGLYSATLPLIVYSLFTTSSQVSPGPVAPTSILLEGMVRTASGAAPRTPVFISTHYAMALVSGVIQLILALLRFGWVADLLSWPVMSGFASSAGMLIVASQLADFFGLKVPKESTFIMRIVRVCENIATANGPTCGVALISLVFLLYARQVSIAGRKLPSMTPLPLITVFVAVLVSYLTDLGQYGVKLVGPIPSSLPTPVLPVHTLDDVLKVLPSAAILAVINYVQTISLAVIFGKKVNENVEGTQEMVALGASSVVASFFQSYTVAGSFTRTTVQSEAGARTPAVIAFTGCFMVIFILTITRVLQYLPVAVLAAIVISSTKQLFNFTDAVVLMRSKPSDALQLVVTVIAVLVFDIMYGLLIGMAFSLLLVLYRSFKPRMAELGRLPGTDVFVARDRYPDTRPVPGVVILRLDGELHFGNVRIITEKLYALLLDALAATKARAAAAAVEEGGASGEEPSAVESSTGLAAVDIGESLLRREDSANRVTVDTSLVSVSIAAAPSPHNRERERDVDGSVPARGGSGNNEAGSSIELLDDDDDAVPRDEDEEDEAVATVKSIRANISRSGLRTRSSGGSGWASASSPPTSSADDGGSSSAQSAGLVLDNSEEEPLHPRASFAVTRSASGSRRQSRNTSHSETAALAAEYTGSAAEREAMGDDDGAAMAAESVAGAAEAVAAAVEAAAAPAEAGYDSRVAAAHADALLSAVPELLRVESSEEDGAASSAAVRGGASGTSTSAVAGAGDAGSGELRLTVPRERKARSHRGPTPASPAVPGKTKVVYALAVAATDPKAHARAKKLKDAMLQRAQLDDGSDRDGNGAAAAAAPAPAPAAAVAQRKASDKDRVSHIASAAIASASTLSPRLTPGKGPRREGSSRQLLGAGALPADMAEFSLDGDSSAADGEQRRVRFGGTEHYAEQGAEEDDAEDDDDDDDDDEEEDEDEEEQGLKAVILDASRVVDIDASACRELQSVMEAFKKAKTEPKLQLLFAALPGPVRDTLDRFGVERSVDPASTRFLSVTAAIASLYEREDEEEEWDAITRDISAYTSRLRKGLRAR